MNGLQTAAEKRVRAQFFYLPGLANRFALCIGFAVGTDVIPGSSVVEQLTVNQLVAGSNPARGATLFRRVLPGVRNFTFGAGMWTPGVDRVMAATKLIGRMPC